MRYKNGFTIVELLIVIVVIAILATTTIVAFNGVQNRANDSAVYFDASNFSKRMETIKLDNSETYPDTLTSDMGFKFVKNSYDKTQVNVQYCYNSSTGQYLLQLRSSSGQNYQIVNGDVSKTSVNRRGNQVCAFVGINGTNPIFGYDPNRPSSQDKWFPWTN